MNGARLPRGASVEVVYRKMSYVVRVKEFGSEDKNKIARQYGDGFTEGSKSFLSALHSLSFLCLPPCPLALSLQLPGCGTGRERKRKRKGIKGGRQKREKEK